LFAEIGTFFCAPQYTRYLSRNVEKHPRTVVINCSIKTLWLSVRTAELSVGTRSANDSFPLEDIPVKRTEFKTTRFLSLVFGFCCFKAKGKHQRHIRHLTRMRE